MQMGWWIYVGVSFFVAIFVASLVSKDIESQANNLSWRGIPVDQTRRRAGLIGLYMLAIVFAVLVGIGHLFTTISWGGSESTTYLGHDEQVENGSVIYTGN